MNNWRWIDRTSVSKWLIVSIFNDIFNLFLIFWPKFVAHPNVQQLLAAIWYDGLPGFRRKSMIGQFIEIGKLGAMFPVYSTIYMLSPTSPMGLFMKKPFVKFICHSSSYAFFLSKSLYLMINFIYKKVINLPSLWFQNIYNLLQKFYINFIYKIFFYYFYT